MHEYIIAGVLITLFIAAGILMISDVYKHYKYQCYWEREKERRMAKKKTVKTARIKLTNPKYIRLIK